MMGGIPQVLQAIEGAALGAVRRYLEGRALIQRTDDPVLPWVRRVAEAIFEGMKADASRDPAWIERARSEWDSLMAEVDDQSARWEAEGRSDYARRLKLVLRRAP